MQKFQKFFDIAMTGVITQKALAKDALGCFYRTPEGNACPVGHLLADEHFEPWMNDDVNVMDRALQKALLASQPDLTDDPETWRFLDLLQRAHDHAEDILEFIWKTQKLATEYDLKMPA